VVPFQIMRFVLIAILFSAVMGPCYAATYNCTTLNLPGTPTGINNLGTIVGSANDGHGFVRDPSGTVTLVDYPGLAPTRLYTINNNGVSVGFAGNGNPGSVIFTRDAFGNFAVVTTVFSPVDPVWGINDAGAISVSNGSSPLIIHPDGTTTTVSAPTGAAAPGSLSNSLQVLEVGTLGRGSALGAPGADPVDLAFNDPPNLGPTAYGLNNAGVVVGWVGENLQRVPAFGPPFGAFVRDASGVYSNLICGGLHDPQPYAINDSGNITGVAAGVYFLASPINGTAEFQSSASSVDMGSVPYVQTSAPMTFTITNTGNVRMDFGAIRLKGDPSQTNSPYFAVTACMVQGEAVSSLDPGVSCMVSVTAVPSLYPAAPGAVTSDLIVVEDSSPGSPHILPVSATIVKSTPPPFFPGPFCGAATLTDTLPRQLSVSISDPLVGLQSVVVASATNATVSIPPSTTTSAGQSVVVAITEINSQQPAFVQLLATDKEGVSKTCVENINGGSNIWTPMGISVQGRVVVAYNYLGRIDAFARSADNTLIHASQTAIGMPLGAWESLGGVIESDPAVVSSGDGTLDVFAVGTDTAVWHIAQNGSTQNWSNWQSLGGSVAGNPVAISDFSDNIVVLARGTDSALWVNAQPTGQGPWTGFASLGGYILSDPAVESDNDLSLRVVARGGDDTLWQIGQSAPGSLSWKPWSSMALESIIGSPIMLRYTPPNSTSFLLEVFAVRSDHSVARTVQTGSDSQFWSQWNSLGGYVTSRPAIAYNNDGRLEVFARGGDKALWDNVQTSFDGPWGGWRSFGGVLDEALTAFTDFRDGRMVVYARAPDGSLWALGQVFAGYWN
jgi:hypothetical protein